MNQQKGGARMRRYDFVLWDWNGTLLDDLELNLAVENELLRRRGLFERADRDYYLAHFAFPIIDFYRSLGFDFSKEDYAAVACEYADLYASKLHEAALFSDAVPVLDALAKDGAKQVVISATEHDLLQKQVASYGLSDRFNDVLGSENNLGKSKVAVARDWLANRKVDPRRTLFVGDTTHDFETAQAIGCDCILVSRGHNSRARLETTGCPVCDDLRGVLRAVRGGKTVLIAPDSFKGTLSATTVAHTVAAVLRERAPALTAVCLPIADGGEGTVDAYLEIFGGEKQYMTAKSPLGHPVEAAWALLPDGTAVVETAAASGIAIEQQNDALRASSYGTGELVRAALDSGCKTIPLGLGGSAMTDGGTGFLAALGARFLDENGTELPPGGGSLIKLKTIDLSRFDPRVKHCTLRVLCDVENPLCGPRGAAYIYAPQKGASPEDVQLLDKGLQTLAAAAAAVVGKDEAVFPGAGAAGGLGFALKAFCGATLVSGIDCLLDAAHFEEKAKTADLIITGEGKMDAQSLMGKAPFGVAKRAGSTPVIAVVGLLDANKEDVAAAGIAAVYETNDRHLPFDEIKESAKADLIRAAKRIEI
jgi:glycerate kinase